MDGVRNFFEAFIPLFVAIDPFGMVPVFIGVTAQLSPSRKRGVTFEAVGAALVIAMAFMFLGNAIFRFLGIEQLDFRIAGGILLLVLAVLDLVITGKPSVHESELTGIVPLAMPLIAGPATLTTLLMLAGREGIGYLVTSLALAANLLILLILLLLADRIARWLGENFLRALSKLVMVLLAAIAINFIRTGILDAIRQVQGGAP